MQKIAGRIKAFAGRFPEAPFTWWLGFTAVLSLILYFVLEFFCRGSLIQTVVHIFSSPLVFILNYAIIMLSFSPTLFIKKRIPLTFIVFAVWLALGISNGIVLSYRSYPLSAIDFLVVKSMMNMATIYFSVVQLILIGIVILAVIAATVIMFIKCPHFRVSLKGAVSSVLILSLTVVSLHAFAVDTDAADYEAGELDVVYGDYGFVYCFMTSLMSQGVDRPDGYDPTRTDELVNDISSESLDNSEITGAQDVSVLPNIVIVQLESFIDLSNIKGIDVQPNPTPNFSKFKNDGVSGYLRVPHVGGGTANIEFEVLTGMNLDHFGFGEYPYTTVLKTNACESIAANLKTLGYGAHAMHNHIASFYDRDLAYASLGFDTFTPIEMMCNVTRNPLGWARDEVMLDEILSALDSTESPDVVFAVSVQGHGKYPEEPLDTVGGGYINDSEVLSDGSDGFEILGIADDTVVSQFAYYASQTHEMDLFVGKLIDELEARGEPYVAVIYGDHLPALPIDESDLVSGDMYNSEYAVVSNIALGGLSDGADANLLDRDLDSTHLAAYVQQLCGLTVGSITKLHCRELDTGEDHDDLFEQLEYKQLYDSDIIEFERTDISFGTRARSVEACTLDGNTLEIKGSGFTEYTEVKLDGIKRDAVLVDSSTLIVENVYFDYYPV